MPWSEGRRRWNGITADGNQLASARSAGLHKTEKLPPANRWSGWTHRCGPDDARSPRQGVKGDVWFSVMDKVYASGTWSRRTEGASNRGSEA